MKLICAFVFAYAKKAGFLRTRVIYTIIAVGLDSEKSIFSEKMRKEGKRGEMMGKRGKIDVVRAYKGRI